MFGGMRLAIAVVLCAALTVPARAELDLRRASIERLGNGLTLILLEDHSFPLVSAQIVYKSGSRDETAGKSGLAHFLEHLAFRASAQFPNGAATEAIYDSGGEWHGYTWLDQTIYYSTMPKDGLEVLLRIEADRMANVTIDRAAIEAEKGAVITEMHGYENDPDSLLLDALTATALQAHPYRNNTIGYESDVRGLTLEDSRAFYERHYSPGNAVLAIAGDFDPAEARALVAKAFGPLPARPLPDRVRAIEPAQKGERRTTIVGPVASPRFAIAFSAPAASSPDFAVFLVLQQLMAGGSGASFRQNDWGTPATEVAILHGLTSDTASWFIPTADPYVFVIKGSVGSAKHMGPLEAELQRRIGTITDVSNLEASKAAVRQQLLEDIETTEDAAHQLAFFEGIGALDMLVDLPRRIDEVSAEDIRRVARDYLAPDRRTIAWMVPGKPQTAADLGAGQPRPTAARAGSPPSSVPAPAPVLVRLAGGLPVIVQPSPLSPTVAVQLLTSSPTLGAITRSGAVAALPELLDATRSALDQRTASPSPPSHDPAERMEQLIVGAMHIPKTDPSPLLLVVAGTVDPASVMTEAAKRFGSTSPAARPAPVPASPAPQTVRETIALPLAQGSLGYVVRTPPPGTSPGLAARLMLYILTHDYSGRLGRSAITAKGLAYHIYSAWRSDGANAWATIWTGVDPAKADALEAELRALLAGLAANPPTAAEVEAAKRHLLGRDLSAAQSNAELASKLTREFIETGGLRSHADLERALAAISVADVAAAARPFADGTVIRVDVAGPISPNTKR
ncbi:MAG: insulinase family protein [Sphingomicrobium sp.]